MDEPNEPREYSSANTIPDLLEVLSDLLAVSSGEETCAIHGECHDNSCPGRQAEYQVIRQFDPMKKAVIMRENPKLTAESGTALRDSTWMAHQNYAKFDYDELKLSPGMIRLLRIKPATFIANIIECEIFVTPLDKAEEFNALSYNWGKSVFDAKVLCNGLTLAVTSSLEQTLKVYRRSLSVFNQRPIWVDAVCINQSSVSERTSQIQLMQAIYSSATTVVVDLGEANHTWNLGFETLIKCSNAHQLSNDYRPQEQSALEAIFSSVPHPTSPAWSYYANIYSSPWFRRTWILQEIALAKDAQLRYGRFIFPWTTFIEASTFFRRTGWYSHRVKSEALGQLSLMSILDICDLSKKHEEETTSLVCALRIARDQQVTDDRDKVIGILGLVSNGPTSQAISYIANYSHSVDGTYHRLATHLVKIGAAMHMLPHAGIHRRSATVDSNLPSWAPDWTAQTRSFGPKPLAIFRPTSYSTATSSEVRVQLEIDSSTNDDDAPPRILSVWGWCFDTIQHLSDAHPLHKETEQPTNIEIQRMFLVWHNSVLACLAKAKANQKLAHENIAEALARTLLVDDLYTGKNRVSGAAASITDPVGCHARVLADLELSKNSSSPAKHINYDWTEDSTFAQQVFAACPSRRFAITASGFFCLVPSISKMGDGIAIFSGAATPFIIRELGPQGVGSDMVYIDAQLVGDAYVHELMDGEIVRGVEALREIRLH